MLDAVHLQHVLVESEEINKAMSYCAAQWQDIGNAGLLLGTFGGHIPVTGFGVGQSIENHEDEQMQNHKVDQGGSSGSTARYDHLTLWVRYGGKDRWRDEWS